MLGLKVAFLAMAAGVLQAVEAVPSTSDAAFAPAESPPPGCYPNYDGAFTIGWQSVSTSKRDIHKVGPQPFESICFINISCRETTPSFTLRYRTALSQIRPAKQAMLHQITDF